MRAKANRMVGLFLNPTRPPLHLRQVQVLVTLPIFLENGEGRVGQKENQCLN